MNIYTTLLALVLSVGFSSAFAQKSTEKTYVEKVKAFERVSESNWETLDPEERLAKEEADETDETEQMVWDG